MLVSKSIYRRRNCVRLFSTFALFFGLALPRLAWAQCSRGSALGFQNVSVEPGNPLQAEYSVRITPSRAAAAGSSGSALRSVSRDSQGRLRVEHSRGKYDVVNPDGTQNAVERTSVFICDPSTGTYVHLDSLKKTATVHKPLDAAAPDAAGTRPFCTRFFEFRTTHDPQATDLGRQQVAGLAAHGLRFWSALQPFGLDSTSSFTHTDTWCSDDLGAIVSLVVVSANGEFRRETVLEKFSRKDPDPALFQIPAGYTRLEPETAASGRAGVAHRSGETSNPY